MSYHDYYVGHLREDRKLSNTLAEGSVVYLSEQSVDSRFYPTESKVYHKRDTVPVYPGWSLSNNLKPVLVLESVVTDKGSSKKYVPVWIENKFG